MHQILQKIQPYGVFQREGADALAPERANMPLGAQKGGQIAGQGADIDALAGQDGDLDMVGVSWIETRRDASSTVWPLRARS